MQICTWTFPAMCFSCELEKQQKTNHVLVKIHINTNFGENISTITIPVTCMFKVLVLLYEG